MKRTNGSVRDVKSVLFRNSRAVIMCVALLLTYANTQVLFAQEATAGKSEVLSSATISARFNQLKGFDLDNKNLASDLSAKGFKAMTSDKNYVGRRQSFQLNGQTVTVEWLMQDYGKTGSKDIAALGRVKVSFDDRTEIYSFSLFFEGGDVSKVTEYKTDSQNNVIKANSWWSCFQDRVKSKCGATCLTALISCAGSSANSVSEFVGCFLGSCGVCALGAAACCTCDCKWYCKAICGCCDR